MSSILFEGTPPEEITVQPDFFRDVNLDQIIGAVTTGLDEYNLKPLFYGRPRSVREIEYRQEVMRDFEKEALFRGVADFSAQMRRMRAWLARTPESHYKHEGERWLLDGAHMYCSACVSLLGTLKQNQPASRGLLAFRDFLEKYLDSTAFTRLKKEVDRVKGGLDAIRYTLLINGQSITVDEYRSEADYSAKVVETFSKFRHVTPKDYRATFTDATVGMNHVEAMVLEGVVKMHPKEFAALGEFASAHPSFIEPDISSFDREAQFYLSWIEYLAPFKKAGLPFTYPRMSETSRDTSSKGSFDLALARNLVAGGSRVISNDFSLNGVERLLVITGPNQGGKTTFARVFGQIHWLAAIGCPVQGTEARFFFFDRMHTHFEREEEVATLRSKLEDDLTRLHQILDQSTPKSIIILNEIFASTTLQDALALSKDMIARVAELDATCVCVTFIDEISALNEKTVSMVAGVMPDNPAVRTFCVERRRADGLAYAAALAGKYGLTYTALAERMKS